MKKLLLLILVCLSITLLNKSNAQYSRYIIQFKNKATNPYSLSSPINYLSQRSIDKKTQFGIAIDSADLPITPRYIDSIKSAGAVTILNKSKWLNCITIQTTDAVALAKIRSFSFVATANNIAARLNNISNSITTKPKNKFEIEKLFQTNTNTQRTTATQDFYNYGNTYNEIRLNNGNFLHNIGLRGQGMLIALLDAGFYHYTTLSSFDSVNANNQVLQTWDFVSNHASVIEDDTHGMSCFSTIAGNIPGTFIGNAPKANFVLYRTEDSNSEFPIEEFNWVCGLEKADSIGADIISTSLGYSTFDSTTLDYTYNQMNGKTTIAAKGGILAHRKGLLLFTAMGNEGTTSWKYLSTPADLDSTISVGAVNASGVVGSFSSYGPASDGRIKPEACAVGVSAFVQNGGNAIIQGNGTSYACPKMAGLGTCLKQGFPEQNIYTIREAIIKSGNNYTTPNDRIGYGITDMKKAFVFLLNKYAKINNANITNCKTTINWQSKDVSSMKYEIERQTSTQTTFTKIADIQGTGSILGNKNLSYADTLINIQSGLIKYRIKQIVDTSASGFYYSYIDSVTINLSSSCVATNINNISQNNSIVLQPNPASNFCNLNINTDYSINKLTINIFDITGKLLKTISTFKTQGAKNINLSVANFNNGIYLVQVLNNNTVIKNLRLAKF